MRDALGGRKAGAEGSWAMITQETSPAADRSKRPLKTTCASTVKGICILFKCDPSNVNLKTSRLPSTASLAQAICATDTDEAADETADEATPL
jgi:hypothetical protein